MTVFIGDSLGSWMGLGVSAIILTKSPSLQLTPKTQKRSTANPRESLFKKMYSSIDLLKTYQWHFQSFAQKKKQWHGLNSRDVQTT